jgi:predicted nucleotidyltransferase component of viral defense system
MILQSEILKIAERERVTPDTIDKNWVLGHVLAELFRTDWAQQYLVFKGGTCLKKCYFKDYRFSEDLDFTLTNANFTITEKLLKTVCNRITEQIGILFSIKFAEKQSNNTNVGYEATVKFWGANHKRNQQPVSPDKWHTSIKMDIIHYEIIVDEPVKRHINDNFSDSNLLKEVEISCYSFSEIIAEKFRSLLQRSYSAPRDYYDLWNLLKMPQTDWNKILAILPEKFKFKKIQCSDFHDFFAESRLHSIKRAWNNSLGGHLPIGELPDANTVLAELENICEQNFKLKLV